LQNGQCGKADQRTRPHPLRSEIFVVFSASTTGTPWRTPDLLHLPVDRMGVRPARRGRSHSVMLAVSGLACGGPHPCGPPRGQRGGNDNARYHSGPAPARGSAVITRALSGRRRSRPAAGSRELARQGRTRTLRSDPGQDAWSDDAMSAQDVRDVFQVITAAGLVPAVASVLFRGNKAERAGPGNAGDLVLQAEQGL
jgi:hypothetical protein